MLTYGSDFVNEEEMQAAVLGRVKKDTSAARVAQETQKEPYKYGVDYDGKGAGDARDAVTGKGNISSVEHDAIYEKGMRELIDKNGRIIAPKEEGAQSGGAAGNAGGSGAAGGAGGSGAAGGAGVSGSAGNARGRGTAGGAGGRGTAGNAGGNGTQTGILNPMLYEKIIDKD